MDCHLRNTEVLLLHTEEGETMVKGAKKKKTWSDYTAEEINKIKEERCVNCPYVGHMDFNYQTGKGLSCDFLGITHHVRGCLPDQCEHYKDDPEEVKKMISDNKRKRHVLACATNNSNRR